MDIKNFFDDKGKVESFLKAKTEQEAKSILESECGKVSDDEFNEIKKGFLTALSEEALGEASGGINMSALKSPLAKTVYKVGGATLAMVGVAATAYTLGSRSGYKAGYDEGYDEGYDANTQLSYLDGYSKGCLDVNSEYKKAASGGVESWINKAGIFEYRGTGVDPTYHQIVSKE